MNLSNVQSIEHRLRMGCDKTDHVGHAWLDVTMARTLQIILNHVWLARRWWKFAHNFVELFSQIFRGHITTLKSLKRDRIGADLPCQ